MSEKLDSIIRYLESMSNSKSKEGMAHYGINAAQAWGIAVPVLRQLAKQYRKDHELALELWESGYHEARILASMVDDPLKCTSSQMEQWVVKFDSWDVCDQVCMNLFYKTGLEWQKIKEWAERDEEFVRRASFALMAVLALHAKNTDDKVFIDLLSIIEKHSTDNRNFVKKAVNWALRQIGKKNRNLHSHALLLSEKLMNSENKTSRWIGSDAYRELNSEAALSTLDRRDKKHK